MARRAAKRPAPTVPALEWAAAAFGALVALFLIGLVVLEAARSPGDRLPRLDARVVALERAGTLHFVDLELSNASAQSAATVQVEATLRRAGAEVDQGSATIDYVPGNSTARGGIVLREDPRGGQLEVAIIGFEIP